MTATITDNPVFSRMTLAVLQDSGWVKLLIDMTTVNVLQIDYGKLYSATYLSYCVSVSVGVLGRVDPDCSA